MLTREQVIRIVGRLDDRRIAEIIATDATEAELMEATTRLATGGDLGSDLERTVKGRVARLCDILTADEADWEESL